MDELLRKLRGLLGVGLTWGTAWAGIGAVIGVLIGVLSPEASLGASLVLEWAIGMGVYGLVSGVGFGKLLSFYEGRKRLGDLSLSRVALWGIAGSAAVPLLFGALGTFEPGTTTRDLVEAMLVTASLGGSFAAASLALARRAEGPEDAAAPDGGDAPPRLLAEPLPDPLAAPRRSRATVT